MAVEFTGGREIELYSYNRLMTALKLTLDVLQNDLDMRTRLDYMKRW